MRLWRIHPKYLDRIGLVALWRESLLARKVLSGETKGYKSHPQLETFREHRSPMNLIDAYLLAVWEEGDRRGFRFDRSKLPENVEGAGLSAQPTVTTGQLTFELAHLLAKLASRDKAKFGELNGIAFPLPNPVFTVVDGPIEPWERV